MGSAASSASAERGRAGVEQRRAGRHGRPDDRVARTPRGPSADARRPRSRSAAPRPGATAGRRRASPGRSARRPWDRRRPARHGTGETRRAGAGGTSRGRGGSWSEPSRGHGQPRPPGARLVGVPASERIQHEHAVICMIMHMSHYTVAVAGASGYAGGEVLRLLLRPPRRRDRRPHRAARTPGRPLGALQPHLRSAGRPRPRADDQRREPLRPRRGLPGAAARRSRARSRPQLPERDGRDRLRRRLPARRPGRVGAVLRRRRTPGTWPYGLPELPGRSAARCVDARRIAVPGCYPTVVHARRGAGRRRRAGRAATSSWSPRPAPAAPARAPKPHLLGSEVMGTPSAYGVGGTHRHTPEIVQNLAALTDRAGAVSFTPLLVPMPRGHPRHLLGPAASPGVDGGRGARGLARGVRRRAVRRACCRRASGRRPRPCTAATPSPAGGRRRDRRPPGRRRRDRQPGQGHRRGPRSSR